MPGPPPKDPSQRRRRNRPARGEFRESEVVGWQHGPVPDPPEGLHPDSVKAWNAWMEAWFAAFWGPWDIPCLRVVARLHDQVIRGNHQRSAELRYWSESFGITPTGQQKLRWARPKDERREPVWTETEGKDDPYAHLRIVREPVDRE